MAGATVVAILALAAGLLAIDVVGRTRRWRAGRPAGVDWLRGLVALPKRYLVNVHGIVLRDRSAARMHQLAAGGFVGSLPLVLIVHGLGIALPFLAWVLLLALVAVAIGADRVLVRRLKPTPRLSYGRFRLLAPALFAYAASLFWLTLPAADLMQPVSLAHPGQIAALALFAWSSFELIVGMGRGPMRHALYGALHLVCHPRPERFSRSTAVADLEPLDLDAPKLGIETPADLAWNRLLSTDACVQCGRCEIACPAFAAGLPLNPKKLVQDIAIAMSADRTSDRGYAGSSYPGLEERVGEGSAELPLVGGDAMIHPDTLWACTTCRACVEECPMMIEHVDAIIGMRRFQTLELGATPGKAAPALADLAACDNMDGRDPATRLDFATDLAPPLMRDKGSADVLLWVGDAAFDLRGQRTLRALMRILRVAGVDAAVLGPEELDCGDLARRLGDEAQFQRLARGNVETLAHYEFRRIVTADPHALHSLRNEYPAFGGHYTVLHHTALLVELFEGGRIEVDPTRHRKGAVTYHDPCYLGRYNGEIEAPRRLLDLLGVERLEMERSGMRSRCCGGGGGAPLTDVQGKWRIPDMRMQDVRETGAGTVAVACPNCAVMLEGVTGPRPQVLDVAEIVLACLVERRETAA